MDTIRLPAPSSYRWNFSLVRERIRREPLDYIVVAVFAAHALGFLALLVYLRVQRAKKKQFVVSY